MIYQLHHQFKDGKTQACSQRENPGGHDQLRGWLEETKKSHPLPDNAQWMICNEDSEYFCKTFATSSKSFLKRESVESE